ncbi:MAG: IS4 family transposase, partial [Terrimicrobiaceae bacterium]
MNPSDIQLRSQDSTSPFIAIAGIPFDEHYLLEVARSSNFYKRTPRKIDVCNLLVAICIEGLKGSPSCNDLAANIETQNPCHGPSRQAVHQRMNPALAAFIGHILENLIAKKLFEAHRKFFENPDDSARFAGYERVLVQDSTVIKLPAHLFDEFSGVANATSKACNARVQAIYDLVSGRLIHLSIDPYSKNDLAAAPDLQLQPNDLVLRDRGYLILDEIQRHLDAKADCIYRHKTGTTYLDPHTKKPIDLLALLRKNGYLDIPVLLNNESQTPVRLCCAPVSEEIANLRRMKARNETRGRNPSKALLELLSWSIFITTIDAARADFKKLLAIYGLRWRIEIVFKAWKSHMKFGNLHRVSKSQMLILLKARLLLITCCTNILYRALETTQWQKHTRRISLLKLVKFLAAAPENLLRALKSLSADMEASDGFHKALLRYCCYDQRKRQNFS